MTVVLRNANDPTATYPHPTTYTYKSASCELGQNTIDDAVDQLIQDMGEADYYAKYDAAKLVHVRNENIAHRPYEEVSLRDLPLYGINRIGDRQCPDDKVISTTQNQCVIDGLFAFLYVHSSDKRLTRSKLISELGSANPSINQLEAWVTNEEYQYYKYVSIYIFDPFRRTAFYHQATVRPKVFMHFTSNNQHLAPITVKAIADKIRHFDRIDFTKLEHRDGLMSDNYDFCDYDSNADTIGKCTKPYVLLECKDLSLLT
jgi:hypothetical protein